MATLLPPAVDTVPFESGPHKSDRLDQVRIRSDFRADMLGTQPSRHGDWLRPLNPRTDSGLLHRWLSSEHAHFWGLGKASQQQIAAIYRDMQQSATACAYLGWRGSRPCFLLEHYRPECDPVGQHYPVRIGDHGMHFALAPPQDPIHGFSIQVLCSIVEILFRDTVARRIVVEPDIGNMKIHRLNRQAGFRYARQLSLPTKTACLGLCSRTSFANAQRRLWATP